MEDRVSLQFANIRNQELLVTLLALVAATLVVVGVWQFIRRRWRYGVMCMTAAAGPPIFLSMLVIEGVLRHMRGRRRAANASLLAAGAVLAGTLAALAFVLSVGADTDALWMSLLGLWVAMAIGVFYAAVFSHLGTKRITTLMLLRTLAILVLLVVLFKPTVSIAPDLSAYKPYLPIIVDRSGSMSVVGENQPTRYAMAVERLATQQQKIQRHFRSEWYHFARRVDVATNVEEMYQLKPTGEYTDSTDIARAVEEVAQKYGNAQLPGLLVLTDGVHNASGAEELRRAVVDSGLPIFVVGLGSRADEGGEGRNIQIVEVNAPPEAIKDNITTIQARVRISGFAGEAGEVKVFEENATEPIVTQRIWTDKPLDTISVPLKWTPKSVTPTGEAAKASSGVRKLRIVAATKAPTDEAVTGDNETELHILVTEPRLRVVYIEGTIRPEFGALRRMLDTDPNVQLASLVRVDKNRFWSRGRIDGKTLAYLPTTDNDFKRMDVLILGDMDRSFLEPAGGGGQGRMTKILEFVQNGGGLLMLGGQRSFGPGGYTNTPIEKALPVIVGGRAQRQEAIPFLPQLTSPGVAHPIFEGIADFFPGPGGRVPKASLPKLAPLRGCVSVEKVKPGALLLAINAKRRNAAGPLVALAVRDAGAGRSAAFTCDTTWQWDMPLRALGADSPYQRFWGQLIRWLAKVDTKSKESKSSVVIRLDHTYVQAGRKVKVSARVQDEKGRSVPKGSVTCRITAVDASTDPDVYQLVGQEGGKVFNGEHRPGKKGKYKVQAIATDAAGKTLGSDEIILTVAPYSAEMANVAMDEKTLRDMASQSRGIYADLPGLPEVIDQIVERQRLTAGPIPLPTEYPTSAHWPIWFTVFFVIFVGLISAEWIMRRNWQLH